MKESGSKKEHGRVSSFFPGFSAAKAVSSFFPGSRFLPRAKMGPFWHSQNRVLPTGKKAAVSFFPRFFLREQKKAAGQIAIEFLLLAVFLLAIITIVGGFSLLFFSDSVSNSQVRDALRVLQTGVNHVYGMGPGNTVVVSVSLPQNVLDSNVGGLSGKELAFTVAGFGGNQSYWAMTDANVIGTIPSSLGTFSVRVTSDVNHVLLALVGE